MSEKTAASEKYVLDTSAWLTLIEVEAGEDVVRKIIEHAADRSVEVLSSFVSYVEVHYITLQEHDEHEASVRLQLMESLPVLRVESNIEIGAWAAQLKAKYRISFADAWVAALALSSGATLIHKDPEFDEITELQQVVRLPLKGVGKA